MALFGKRVRIGDLLLSQGMITQQQLDTALSEQKIRKTKLGETLIALGYVSQKDFSDVLSRQLGVESVDLRKEGLQDAAIRLVPEDIMKKYELVPFAIDENNSNILKIAMSDPMYLPAIDDVSLITGMEVVPYFAPTAQIAMQIDRMFGKKQAMEAAAQYQLEHADELREEEESASNAEVDNAPIVKIVRTMLEQAIRQGASDIHIEPLERNLRIRYRIDGALREVMDYNTTLLPAMVARVKIMSGLDISEKRKPQDGRLTLQVDNREYDVRVSVLPTVFGEKTVMRLTAKDGLSREKKYLGLTPEDEERLDGILKNPHGIILVTGPTGSGKSTTCYTVLSELNREEVNIITVEDPVEANVDGVNQVQVNVKADLTFANALRSILRQDPDIIMVGEIRDGETAGIAVKASITGHLVISTLHTNSTAASITRLIDMGVEPYLIGDSVVGIIAQRLVRKLCPKCRKAREATDQEKKLLMVPASMPQTVYEPVGCEDCGGIGYRGRTAIYEIMPVTAKLRNRIHDKVTADELQEIAVSEGMSTLRMAAAKKVKEGITSCAEMIKVAYDYEAD
ncbi:ATPase, T2SS/T4P/T4SS family [Suilimivivens aceti]|uniref:ATPase, T2SS/T4P/T4SS family n=1 Tax=Suilimivivens aceti TaxID=2981774 RepID=A0ABT2T0D8_9FIRM|nr:ATPase, T2SS/T4P/T4SS family [Suilimivivens aceti]MCU6743675.1 ATPase, T2SS/T4P/T4SS family [Suilimivivens aceti]SCH33840.1 Type II traffic warden ATPase [uncultured Clostridium sp.]